MRSIKWRKRYNFNVDSEWISSPDVEGLWIPFRETFYPGISKSAPCNCCPSGPDNSCSLCTSHMPSSVTLSDPVYGGCTLTFSSGVWVGENSSVPVEGPPDGVGGSSMCLTIGQTITTTLRYSMSCSPTTNKWSMLIQCYECLGVPADTNNIPKEDLTLSSVSSSVSNFPSTGSLATDPQDCSSPNFTFTVGNQSLYFYTSGTVFTVT